MSLLSQQQGKVSLITLPPRMARSDAPALRRQLCQLVEQGQTRLVLDLNRVQHIDASGLSVLLTLLAAIGAQSGGLVLLSPSHPVRSLLVLTQLHRLFEVFEDATAAVNRLHD